MLDRVAETALDLFGTGHGEGADQHGRPGMALQQGLDERADRVDFTDGGGMDPDRALTRRLDLSAPLPDAFPSNPSIGFTALQAPGQQRGQKIRKRTIDPEHGPAVYPSGTDCG